MSDIQGNAHGAPAGAGRDQVPAWRLISTLGVAGAVAGLLIVLVFQWAQPQILANQARETEAAIAEVLSEGRRFQTLFVSQGALTETLPAGVDSLTLDKIWVGYDAADERVGYAIVWGEPGFADVVRVIFGYDSEAAQVLGMKVLENKETPGLGDKIVKDTAFVNGFRARAVPLRGVKAGEGDGAADEVDMITGATISSRTVIDVINHRLAQVQPLIAAYEQRGTP
jgi:electron transport complex protein RnfG